MQRSASSLSALVRSVRRADPVVGMIHPAHATRTQRLVHQPPQNEIITRAIGFTQSRHMCAGCDLQSSRQVSSKSSGDAMKGPGLLLIPSRGKSIHSLGLGKGVHRSQFARSIWSGTFRPKRLEISSSKDAALDRITSRGIALRMISSAASSIPSILSAIGRRPFQHRPPSTTLASTGTLSRIGQRIDRFQNSTVLYLLIGLNVLVYLGWQYGLESWRKFGDPRAYLFMSENFLSGLPNLEKGRYWTMITSCISHEGTAHLALNMISLGLMGTHVLSLLGNTTFLGLYFGAGIASALFSAAWHQLQPMMLGKPENKSQGKIPRLTHGASGSVYAILSTFACIAPKSTFLLFFVIPMPAWACIGGIFAWDLWQASFRPGSREDSAGHIGGIIAGLLFWRFKLKGRSFGSFF